MRITLILRTLAIASTPSAESMGATGTLQGEASVKINEGLATARAFQSQDFIDYVIPRLLNFTARLIQTDKILKFRCKPGFHFVFKLLCFTLLQQRHACC